MKDPLEEVIATHPGILVVLFTGAGGAAEEASRTAAREAAAALPAADAPRFLEADLGCRREAARRFGIHGAPAVALFREGRLLGKRLGACRREEILALATKPA